MEIARNRMHTLFMDSSTICKGHGSSWVATDCPKVEEN